MAGDVKPSSAVRPGLVSHRKGTNHRPVFFCPPKIFSEDYYNQLRPYVRLCVRLSVRSDASPDDNFSIYYRISFKFSLWLSCQMTEVKFEFGSCPKFFT